MLSSLFTRIGTGSSERAVYFERLLGSPTELSLEQRLLNAVLLVAVVACATAPPVYLLLDWGTSFLTLGALGMSASAAFLYYLSRFRRWFRFPAISIVLLNILGAIVFFFATAGSHGSAFSIFAVTLIISAALFRGRDRARLMGASLLTPLVLLGVELLLPQLIGSATTGRLTRLLFFACTYSGALLTLSTVTLALVRAYEDAVRSLRAEQARSQLLLDNILPPAVSERLKASSEAIADGFEEVTVLFADIVGFTALSARMNPRAVVDLLNEVFSRFDALCAVHGLEKVKTIGDAYMAVAGVPVPRKDHADAAAAMALAMRQAMPDGVSLRIGLHSGPAVAGVIGTRKFIYDLWGDTVNTASRMESHGEPDRIHLSQVTRERLSPQFSCSARGAIVVKGKGEMETYFLDGTAAPTPAPAPAP